MGLPIPGNTTCDVYHSGNSPPAAPDIAGVKGAMVFRGRNIKTDAQYTHWIDVPLATDVRPGDSFFVPDRNGTKFTMAGYERVRLGGGNDFKRVYLLRAAPTWPTQNL